MRRRRGGGGVEGCAPGEAEKFVLVGPQHRFVLLGVGAAEDVVQVQNDILSSVADNYKE